MMLARKITVTIAVLFLLPTSALAPQSAHAQLATFDALNFIKNTVSAGADLVTSSAVGGLNLKEYVLDSLAWSIGQQLVQSLTASVVNWINGRNSGGFSLFITNLPAHLLSTGDVQALAFFNEFSNSNSPFASIILSSLRTSYLQGTSGAGFWAANQCTLQQFSPNPLAYVGGDFSQGGWSAWFALTTQPQNNPYNLYERSQAELEARVYASRNAQLTQLGWGQGFLSWCGANNGASQAASQSAYLNAGSGSSGVQYVATTPQTCTDSNGNIGSIQTPGSVIHDQLSKALGSNYDRLVTADELNEIVGALVQRVITTVAGDGGLGGLSQPIGGSRPLIDQLAASNTLTSSAGGATTYLTNRSNEIASYQASWQTIANAANAAQAAVTSLSSTCSSYSADASTALSTLIQPALDRAATAQTAAINAQNALTQAQADLNAAQTSSQISTATSEIQALQLMTPTSNDVAQAQSDATAIGSASAPSSTSLQVVGGSLVDQMNLLRTNATNAAASCHSRFL